MHLTIHDIEAVTVAVIFGLWRYTPVLDRLKKKSSADAAAELAISEQTIGRLRAERNKALEAQRKLEQTRSLEPVLTQLAANAELQAQVLDRLAHHNGSFKHMEVALRDMAEGMKLLTGFIAGLADITLKEPRT